MMPQVWGTPNDAVLSWHLTEAEVEFLANELPQGDGVTRDLHTVLGRLNGLRYDAKVRCGAGDHDRTAGVRLGLDARDRVPAMRVVYYCARCGVDLP